MQIQMPLPGGRRAAYIVQRGGRASQDQTNLNMWFRLILIGGGGTLQMMRSFEARGDQPAPPPGRSVWGGPPSGRTSARWSLDPSRCFLFRF
jgi:hypothetical protein